MRAFDLDLYQRQLRHLPLDTLVSRGMTFCTLHGSPDSGMVCLDMATTRYRDDMSTNDKKLVVQALTGKWHLYTMVYFDQAKGFECLGRAQRRSEQAGLVLGPLMLFHANAYQNLAEQTGDKATYEKTYRAYLRAYDQCAKEGRVVLNLAFTNMVEVAWQIGKLDSIRPIYERYLIDGKKSQYDYPHIYDYNKLLYAAYVHQGRGEWTEAAEIFSRQPAVLHPGHPESLRLGLMARINQGKALAAANRYPEAEKLLLNATDTIQAYGQSDMLMLNYQYLADLYDRMGDSRRKTDFHGRYLALKDTLLNYKQINSINNTSFLAEMERKDAQLMAKEQACRYTLAIMWIAVAVAVLVIAFLVVLRRKNRRMAETNDRLYRQVMATLERDERPVAQPDPVAKPDTAEQPTDEDREIMARVRQGMETDDAVYQPDFGSQKLAELVGINYSYISQAVNRVTGNNLSSLINDYRVDRACRLLSDPAQSANLTLEAVGYGSRQTFLKAFKARTGLTPSDFRKMAAKNAA